jgi:hypothetical protein
MRLRRLAFALTLLVSGAYAQAANPSPTLFTGQTTKSSLVVVVQVVKSP